MALALFSIAGSLGLIALAPEPAIAGSPSTNGMITYTGFIGNESGVLVVNADGSGLTLLADGSYGVWSPDGRTLAFAGSSGTDRGVFVMRPDGSDQRQLTHNQGGQFAFDVPYAWSPDGERILFERCADLDVCGLFIKTVHGGIVRLTSADHFYDGASWAPDGATIVFALHHVIYSMNADGSGFTHLTHPDLSFDDWPDYSPDGSRIVWSHTTVLGTKGDIWVMDADGSAQAQLSARPTDEEFPSWSPDGRFIAYLCNPQSNGEAHLCVMTSDGAETKVLVPDERTNMGPPGPDWQPLAHQ